MAAKSASPAVLQILEEVGVRNLPQDWDIVRLESLLGDDRGIAVGVMYPGEHDPQGIPLIKAGDLAGGRIDRPEFRITPDKHREYRRTELAGGELLMSLVGDVGRCALVPAQMAGWNAARAVAVLRFRSEADADFVRACLMSAPLQHLMQVWSTTTVQATLNLKEIRQIPLPWPPKQQRDAIARILGTLDDKIQLNRRMNETLEAIARALFKSWFVDFDPVRAKAEGRDPDLPPAIADVFPSSFEDSELGEIPAGWTTSSLDTVAHFLNGLALQNYPPEDGHALPVIKISQLRAGNTDKADSASAKLAPEYVVADGDVIFSWSGSLECVLWAGGPGALNQHLFKVTSKAYPKWFYYLCVHQHLDEFRHIAAGKATTMGHIQRHHLTDAKVAIPPQPVMEAANRLLGPIIEQLTARRVESRTLAALRDTLLPKLISGELRVKDAERVVGVGV